MADLSRFIAAQKKDFSIALEEMRQGCKRTHWMWYIFPQIAGLGMSSTAQYYSISDIEEARAYLDDDYLRENLLEISEVLLQNESSDAGYVMGWPDNLKLKSSMTLFLIADEGKHDVFQKVLDKYYDGLQDERTLGLL